MSYYIHKAYIIKKLTDFLIAISDAMSSTCGDSFVSPSDKQSEIEGILWN